MKNWIRNATLTFILFSGLWATAYSQFLHRDGKMIVDGDGNEVILRGMGLGGWMLQEGYMLDMNSFANPQHQIRARIVDVIGEENTKQFYEAWLANHCTKRDIDSLASWGFNSVRLPMHYNLFTPPIESEPVAGENTWLEKGFALTDSLLKWCAANEMYLILDLHAAPGGQGNDAAISDYDASKPSLWQSEANQQKTVALWRKLAERYANEEWIGGYDLINEPNWNFTAGANKNGCDETTNAPLKELYTEITAAIREVDQNHLIFIEGNCWANNHRGLLPLWDENMAISFHKYWNYNDQGGVQGFVNMRDQYNAPLWLGESGENSNVWFRNAIRLMEDNKIGWAWWPMKKFGSVVNPLTVVKNEGFEKLLTYWKGQGAKPSVDEAKTALMGMAENLKIENTIYRKDVTDAMFRQVYDNSTIPFTEHHAPGTVNATDYDLGRSQHAYYDTDTATYHVSGGGYTAWNSGWAYRNDGVDIEKSTDTHTESNGHNIGWTNDGEWLQYSINVDSSAAYKVSIRYALHTPGAKLKIQVNGVDQSAEVMVPSGQGWSDMEITDILMNKGLQKIRLYFVKGGVNIGFLKFTLAKKTSEVSLKATTAVTNENGKSINLSFNKDIDTSTISNTGFFLTINGSPATITGITTGDSPNKIDIAFSEIVEDNDILRITYNGDDIKATDNSMLTTFADLVVSNTLPVHLAVPGTVEAESFFINEGLQLEGTTDTGGGQNVGYTTAGDYMDYRIRVENEGDHKLEVRIACNSQAGKMELQQLNQSGEVLNTVSIDVPVTGGWQTWQTVTSKMKLNAGSTILRVKIIQPEFNINWFKFTADVISGAEKNKQGLLKLYPNPVEDILMLEIPEQIYRRENTVCIRQIDGKIIKKLNRISNEKINTIDIAGLSSGTYLVEFEVKGTRYTNKFFIR